MGFLQEKQIGYFVDTCFALCFIFSGVFLIDAYNHTGQGVVIFRNKGGETDIADEADRNNRFRGMYVGFDRACETSTYEVTDADGFITFPMYTDCSNLDSSQERSMYILVPITWTLFAFAGVHFLLKRMVVNNDGFKSLVEMGWFRVISTIAFFMAPIALFAVNWVFWDYFIGNRNTLVKKSNDDDDDAMLKGGSVVAFNAEADTYKDTRMYNGGITSTLFLLLVGEFLQALACMIVYFRHVYNSTGSMFDRMFIGLEGYTGINSPIARKVGATVDAAAKNPETKKNAVTSVYANRRVTNGISF